MPLISTVWTSGAAVAGAAGGTAEAAPAGVGAACCASAEAIAPESISVAADARWFSLKFMEGLGKSRLQNAAGSAPFSHESRMWRLRRGEPERQRGEQPRCMRDPLLGPPPRVHGHGFFRLAEIDVLF